MTEELWGRLADHRPTPVIEAPWPTYTPVHMHRASSREMNRVVRLVSEIRSLRADLNVPPGARITLLHRGARPKWLNSNAPQIKSLARLERIGVVDGEAPEGSAQLVVDEASFVLPLTGIIDVEREAARLARQIEKLDGEIARIDDKLAQVEFTERAPEHIVERQRERRAEAESTRNKLAHALDRLATGA